MVTAVFGVDVLDDLFAPLVLKIDIDIRRFFAFLGEEALEQEIHLLGVYLGDAEAITDDGIRGRAASLAENAFRAGEGYDLVDSQEVFRVSAIFGELQFAVERISHLRAYSLGLASLRALFDEVP